jgi:hypothetical protein
MTLIPPTIHIKGDHSKSSLLIPKARQLYSFVANKATLANLDFLTEDTVFSDGSEISISVKRNGVYGYQHGIIDITSIPKETSSLPKEVYMESGFLFHGSNFINNEKSYLPSTVYFNTFISSTTEAAPDNNVLTLINASESRRIKSGDESYAVGSKSKKVKVITTTDSLGIETTFRSPTNIYVENLWLKKLYQTFCPASVFTGKLRLMVQAIYGSLRSDYSMVLGENKRPLNPIPHLDLQITQGTTLTLLSEGLSTSGLYRDPTDEYWLITPRGNEVFARNMKYDKKLLSKVNRLDNKLNEAYILSTLVPDKIEYSIGINDNILDFKPLTYGWKFNQLGDKFSAVLYRPANNLSTEAGVNGFETILMTVSLVYNVSKKLPEVSYTLISSRGFHIPYAQTKVFYPAYFLNSMQCLRGSSGPGNTYADLSAPLYCYYTNKPGALESDSSLVVFNINNGLRQTIDGNSWSYEGQLDWSSGGSVLISGLVDPMFGIYKYTYFKTNKSGVSSTTTSEPCNFIQSFESYENGLSTLSEYLELNNTPQNPIDGVEANPANRYSYLPAHTEATRYDTAYTSISIDYTTLAVIPMFDAEAIMVGERKKVTTILASQFSYVYEGNFFWKNDYWNWSGRDSIGGYLWTTFNHSNLLSGVAATTAWALNSGFPETGDLAGDHYKINTGSSFKKATLYTSRDDKILLVEGGSLISTNMEALLSVSFLDPFFNTQLEVRAGYSSGMKWNLSGTLSGKDEWPIYEDIDFSGPVGWA